MAARRKSAKRKSASKSKAAKRKKPAQRKAGRKKPGGKKPGRKKPARKKAVKKKVTRKKVSRKKAVKRKKAAQKKAPARKKAVAKKKPARKAAPKTPPIEALARKLIQGTRDPAKMNLEELYAESIVSRQPGRPPATGLAGMREKFSDWASMTRSTTWKVRNSFVKQNTICIEWEADITLADGRNLSFEEVAVHRVKGGKIVEERYYYDPAIFESPAAPEEPEEADESLEESLLPSTPVAPPISEPQADLLDSDEPPRRDEPLAPFEEEIDPDEPDIDPLDL